MAEQHSKDYKLTAVKYYLTHNKTMRLYVIKYLIVNINLYLNGK